MLDTHWARQEARQGPFVTGWGKYTTESEVTMQEAIAEWVNWLKVSCSERTVYGYEKHLVALDKTAPHRRPEDWTKAELLQHLSDKRAAGNGDAAIKQIVGALKNFFAYTCGHASPAKDLPYPKVKKKLQRVLDVDEVLRLMAACDRETGVGVRDLAIITLMLDTGLRATETCRLELSRVNLHMRMVTVVIKGGDEAVGVFSRTTLRNLERWLSIRPNHARPECDTFFVSIGGTRPGTTMTRGGLKRAFSYIGDRARVEGFSPHTLRRTFATVAIRSGAPTRVVQVAGRWSDVLMVERYTATITAEDFDPYSPVERVLNYDHKRGQDEQD